MRLESGIPAPAFDATDINGADASLASYEGQKLYLILARFVACPFCSLPLADVARRHSTFAEGGLAVLVVFPSASKRVKRYVGSAEPAFARNARSETRREAGVGGGGQSCPGV